MMYELNMFLGGMAIGAMLTLWLVNRHLDKIIENRGESE